jgi:NADH dehydrogenase FAD-containing subunit
LPKVLKNVRPDGYSCLDHGFVVSLGGKWAILDYKGWYFKGFLGFVFGQLAHLRYYISIVGLWNAVKYLLLDLKLYSRND